MNIATRDQEVLLWRANEAARLIRGMLHLRRMFGPFSARPAPKSVRSMLECARTAHGRLNEAMLELETRSF